MPATTLQYMCDVLTEFPPSCLTLSTTNGFDTTTFKLLDTQYNNGYDYVLLVQPCQGTVDPQWSLLGDNYSAKIYYNQDIAIFSSSETLINNFTRTQQTRPTESDSDSTC